MNRRSDGNRAESGVTLVELLISLVITGAIALAMSGAIIIGFRSTSSSDERLSQNRDVELVRGGERPRVDEPEDAVGHEGASRVGGRVEAGERGHVAHDAHLPRGDPHREDARGERVVHDEDRRGDGDREPLLRDEKGVDERVRGTGEAAPEELGHRLVEVDEERDADEPEGERSEGEEVRDRVDLDEGVAPPRLRPRRRGRMPKTRNKKERP